MSIQKENQIQNDYENYIALSRYARWIESENRRETWPETVKRYCDFWKEKFPETFPYDEVYKAILNREVMPSMRALMTAGKALHRDEIAGYNCSYLAIDNVRAFDEILYILMCGTGVGFSVERQSIAKLPQIPEEIHDSKTTIVVKDSRIGWASALRELISLLYSGQSPRWDVSLLRAAGERLRTFGGRSSGPEPLVDLFNFTTELFKKAVGRRLNSIECHDLVCKIADTVVVGGVRRSALISLSNLTDDRMRHAKSGQWWETEPQRALANNSVVYTEKPDVGAFMREWISLYESKSGERGIFNRVAAVKQSIATGRREIDGHDYGTNPCGEIILRSNGLCNLSEVVIRPNDNYETLRQKIRIATIIGTFQSTLTNFRYLRPIWKRNAEEERLLGVSLTGIMDHWFYSRDSHDVRGVLNQFKKEAIKVNEEWSYKLAIRQSAAITTVKPSGTVSQLVGSASGIHPRYAPYYIRTVRTDKKDPIGTFLKDQGVPCEDDVTKPESMWVFSFPIRSPEKCILRDKMSAIQQLYLYLMYKQYWCEHNPSITVYVRENEWPEVGAWVYKHFDDIGGVSFLPYTDHTYRQAPYQELNEEDYHNLVLSFPEIDWSKFKEVTDVTTSTQELSCMAGVCEIN